MRMRSGFGPANDKPLAVTQELVALMYADDPIGLGALAFEDAFLEGMTGKSAPAVDRYIWESGALAAHLIRIGGQR